MLQGVGGTYFVPVLLYLRYPLPIYPSRDPRVYVYVLHHLFLLFFCVIGELRAPLSERRKSQQSRTEPRRLDNFFLYENSEPVEYPPTPKLFIFITFGEKNFRVIRSKITNYKFFSISMINLIGKIFLFLYLRDACELL